MNKLNDSEIGCCLRIAHSHCTLLPYACGPSVIVPDAAVSMLLPEQAADAVLIDDRMIGELVGAELG